MMTYPEIRARLPGVPLDIIQRLGCEPSGRPLVCDGKEGGRTRTASYLDPQAVCAPIAQRGIADLLAGVQEEARGNRGARIEEYSRGYQPDGHDQGPWCAFAASLWIHEAYPPYPRVGGAIRLVRDHCDPVQRDDLRPDDLIAWRSVTRPAPAGHVGVVALITPRYVWTVEANVDLVGRTDGVAARRFTHDLVRADGARMVHLGRPRITVRSA